MRVDAIVLTTLGGKVRETAMRDHDALRFARGSGRVDHIGGIVDASRSRDTRVG
ncbi:Uncharacterised protein [Mycobacteroides abscessus subsp. abscessus]|nr:Uncharacterised protein [Mycobacteroides abscessus subsp. abscessus]